MSSMEKEKLNHGEEKPRGWNRREEKWNRREEKMQVAKIERHKHVAGVIGAERGKWAEKWAAEDGAEVERI